MKFDFTRPLHTLTLIKYIQETPRVKDLPPSFLPSFALSVRQSFLSFFFLLSSSYTHNSLCGWADGRTLTS